MRVHTRLEYPKQPKRTQLVQYDALHSASSSLIMNVSRLVPLGACSLSGSFAVHKKSTVLLLKIT